MAPSRSHSTIAGVLFLFQFLPGALVSQTPEPAPQPGLDKEESFDQRDWELDWYGTEWSQEYREELYQIGILQRIIHANTLRLPESMRNATFMAAPAPGRMNGPATPS